MPTRPPVENVPVNIVTGFLGVGKTTAIRALFKHRPENEKWAVLVNEFGEIGIDGAILESDGLSVAEVPGGCICCSAGLALRTSLVRILREVRPDRLLIEPTGLAHPAQVIDTLRSPGLREAVDVRAVITLVDPRHCRSPRHAASDPWQDQIRIGDVLVANKVDVSSEPDLEAFHAIARAAWPPKLVVAEVVEGELDPAWLDLGATHEELPLEGLAHDSSSMKSWGQVWPPRAVFERDALEELLQEVVRSDAPVVERLKGVFRVRRGWFLVQATPETIRWSPIGHRRDSRVEMVCSKGDPNEQALIAAFNRVRIR